MTPQILFKRLFPGPASWITGWRNRRYFERRYGALRRAVAHQLFPDGRPMVLSGPFAGLQYINRPVWGPITPKWLGTYELELAPIVSEIAGAGYAAFVDVGCAEGYYATGIARLATGVCVFAFDCDPIAREDCRTLACLNRVERRVMIDRRFTPGVLDALPKGRNFVLIDIEGGEVDLLLSDKSGRYSNCDILVEIHHRGSHGVSEVAEMIARCFRATHEVQCIEQQPRTITHAPRPALGVLGDHGVAVAMEEGRPYKQKWLWMRSKKILRSVENDHYIAEY